MNNNNKSINLNSTKLCYGNEVCWRKDLFQNPDSDETRGIFFFCNNEEAAERTEWFEVIGKI